MTNRVRKSEPKTATSNMTELALPKGWNTEPGTARRRLTGSGVEPQIPPAPGTGNAPVARRVISPYTSGSVVYSPRATVLRLPW